MTNFTVLCLHKVGVSFWWTSGSMSGSTWHREKNMRLFSCFSNQFNKSAPNTGSLSSGILVALLSGTYNFSGVEDVG